MVTADDDSPCRFVADGIPHGRHKWTGLIGDPDDSHVLHIFTDVTFECPGFTS